MKQICVALQFHNQVPRIMTSVISPFVSGLCGFPCQMPAALRSIVTRNLCPFDVGFQYFSPTNEISMMNLASVYDEELISCWYLSLRLPEFSMYTTVTFIPTRIERLDDHYLRSACSSG